MIEYIDEIHCYLANGIIIPSVSQLVQFATGDDYTNIPHYILEQSQLFGTEIHQAIQEYLEKHLITEFDDPYKDLAFEEFLKRKDDIKKPICEMMIDYQERYGGRLDILDGSTLIDIKTNTNLNIPHLEWQLGFYALALESKGIKIDNFKCLWLPKRKSGRWVDITPKPKEELLKVLEDYETNS